MAEEQDVVRIPPALEQNLRAFMHFIGKAVVQIVLHLVDQIVVIQVTQDDFVVSHGIPRPTLLQSQKDAPKLALEVFQNRQFLL